MLLLLLLPVLLLLLAVFKVQSWVKGLWPPRCGSLSAVACIEGLGTLAPKMQQLLMGMQRCAAGGGCEADRAAHQVCRGGFPAPPVAPLPQLHPAGGWVPLGCGWPGAPGSAAAQHSTAQCGCHVSRRPFPHWATLQALTKRPEGRPTAAQLFQHPWVRAHYRQLLAGHAQLTAAAAAAAACTPELRRTTSQPPSPSKSMPGGGAAAGGRLDGSSAATPAAVAALAPFLPLSQAKMAHKVRLLSPGRPPSSSRGAARPRRRVSDPLGRVQAAPLAEPAADVSAAAAATAAMAAAAAEGPPRTPETAAGPTFASDGAGAVAAADDLRDDAVSSSAAQFFETPGTPGLKTTPLNRSRPVALQQRGPLGRTPFLLPSLATPGGGSGGGGGSGIGEMQPLAAGVRKAAPMRSRFAAAAENDEAHLMAAPAGAAAAALALRMSGEGLALSSPSLPSRAHSFTSLGGTRGGGSSSASSPSLHSRTQSFTSFGGSSSSNLTNLGVTAALPAVSPSPKQRPGSGKQQLEGAGEQAAAVEEAMQRLRLLQ